jgi:hypothetical protein
VTNFGPKPLENFGDTETNLLKDVDDKFEDHLHEFVKLEDLTKNEPKRFNT